MESQNQVKEDFLDVDPQIPGQHYVCLSFLEPTKVVKDKKEVFIVKKFLKDLFDNNNLEDLKNLDSNDFIQKFDDFNYKNKDNMNQEFSEANDHVTNIRGLKVRGVYDSQKEANIRAKVLQRMDNNFNVFVGQIGYWLPWDPEPDNIEGQEYLESELNNLMHEYRKNQEQKDLFYNEQLNERKKQTREQNKQTVGEEELPEEDIDSSDIAEKMSQEDPWMKNKKENN